METPLRGPVAKFFLGALKLSLALVVAAGLIAGAAAWYAASAEREQRETNAELDSTRPWNQITIAALDNAQASLQTRWRDGYMYYRFNLDGHPAAFNSSTPTFNIIMLDDGGFEIFSHTIAMPARIVGEGGVNLGYSDRGRFYVSAEDYRRIHSWDVTWRTR